MGIYIKGMEVPTHCMDCPFMVSRDGDDCILQSAEANENFENWEQMKAGCPLVPVPEHGRLGDLDELYASLKKWLIQNRHSMTEATRVWIRGVLEGIAAAPTIIPAEEGE